MFSVEGECLQLNRAHKRGEDQQSHREDKNLGQFLFFDMWNELKDMKAILLCVVCLLNLNCDKEPKASPPRLNAMDWLVLEILTHFFTVLSHVV